MLLFPKKNVTLLSGSSIVTGSAGFGLLYSKELSYDRHMKFCSICGFCFLKLKK